MPVSIPGQEADLCVVCSMCRATVTSTGVLSQVRRSLLYPLRACVCTSRDSCREAWMPSYSTIFNLALSASQWQLLNATVRRCEPAGRRKGQFNITEFACPCISWCRCLRFEECESDLRPTNVASRPERRFIRCFVAAREMRTCVRDVSVVVSPLAHNKWVFCTAP